jgi:AcrR family transcriptional regulator
LTTGRALPRRKDALRNYERLLAAADAAFTAHGVNASLEGVAKAAGVAIGTLYAHFPSRDDLLAALIADQMDKLTELGAQLSTGTTSPEEALRRWLTSFGSGAATYQGLPNSVIQTLQNPESPLFHSCESMRTTCAHLLTAARESGHCRTAIGAEDLLAMTAAVAGAAHTRQQDPATYIAFLTDGLRG